MTNIMNNDLKVSADNLIDEIVRDNKIHRFAIELNFTKDVERKAQLNEILRVLQGSNAIQSKTAKTKLDELYATYHDKAILQSWTKLKKSQRIERLEKYLDALIKDEDNKKEVLKEISGLLEEGKLKTIKDVSYDKEKGQILSITKLTLNSKTGKYKFDKKAK